MGSWRRQNGQMAVLVLALVIALLAALAPASLSTAEASATTAGAPLPERLYVQGEGGIVQELEVVSADDTSSQQTANPTWTLECRSGVADENGRLLQAATLDANSVVEQDGACYLMPAETIDVAGDSYHRTQELVRIDPDGGTVVAYYVPQGYQVSDDYTVLVSHKDIANPSGAPLKTTQYRVSSDAASQGRSEEVSIAKTLRGGSYEIVPGQLSYQTADGSAMSLLHSYYSPTREITVYYRNTNDPAYADAVIHRVDSVFAGSASGQAEQIGQGEVITDEANPLAASMGSGTTKSAEKMLLRGVVMGGLVVGLAVMGVCLFVWTDFKKRKEDE